MNFALFYHSVRSDWNHGNAHFLRGVVRALQVRGHQVVVLEPDNAWSCVELVKDQGQEALDAFASQFPDVRWQTYGAGGPDLDAVLEHVDVAIVHEWTQPDVVAALGRYRQTHSGLTLLFHDTHHRTVSEPGAMARLDLNGYDGVLAFGAVLADAYQRAGWGRRVYTWHEAADVTTFYPHARGPAPRGPAPRGPAPRGPAPRGPAPRGPAPSAPGGSRADPAGEDVVWVGNWGDGERARELLDYLLMPVRRLGARLTVHGVRYPDSALQALTGAGAEYRGWIPGPRVAEVLSATRLTVHVPRRWYRQQLVGIPTIRVFEALACGTPLICAPWQDVENLFRPGDDYLMASDPDDMQAHMAHLLRDSEACAELSRNGLTRILERHTCGHRVAELEQILASMDSQGRPRTVSV